MMKFYKICIVLVFLLFVTPSAMAEQRKLSIAGIGDSIFSAQAIAVLTEAYGRAGIDIEVVRFPAARALAVSSSGAMDGELERIEEVGEQYPSLIRVNPPVHFLDAAVFSMNKPVELKGINTLRHLRVGVILGVKYVDELFKDKGFDVVKVPTIARLFEMLALDRYDVAVVDQFTGWHEVRRLGMLNVHAAEASLVRKPLFHYLHEKNAELVPVISRQLEKMRAGGDIERITNQVLGGL